MVRGNKHVNSQSTQITIDAGLAEHFEVYMKKYLTLYYSLTKKTQAYLPHISSQPILVDLGAGPGLLSVELQKRIPHCSIISLDSSLPMLRRAQKNLINTGCLPFPLLLAQAEHLPLKNNTVDMVINRFTLPYWKTPTECLQEIHRVLKPGGRLIIEELNREFPRWKLKLMKLHMRLKNADQTVIAYQEEAYTQAYTLEQIEHFLTDTCFIILKKEEKNKAWNFIIIGEKP